MSEHYPRVRIRAENGVLVLREGLSISFYMRRPHEEVKHAVQRALEVYLRAVGSEVLSLYHGEEELLELDEAAWKDIRRKLIEESIVSITLRDRGPNGHQYWFEYRGRPIHDRKVSEPDEVCAVSFWLPTEYLEAHGAENVRALVLELAAPLPFCSGHAGLSFNGETDLLGVDNEVHKRCFRYPGLDIPRLGWFVMMLGTRVPAVSWLTFLGQPVLGAVGGAAGLRSRLHSAGTTVQELDGERAVVTLGPWPEAGDIERGDTLPAYRELARVLEPWLYREVHIQGSAEVTWNWYRRFLD
jgi:hypothetical protein